MYDLMVIASMHWQVLYYHTSYIFIDHTVMVIMMFLVLLSVSVCIKASLAWLMSLWQHCNTLSCWAILKPVIALLVQLVTSSNWPECWVFRYNIWERIHCSKRIWPVLLLWYFSTHLYWQNYGYGITYWWMWGLLCDTYQGLSI